MIVKPASKSAGFTRTSSRQIERKMFSENLILPKADSCPVKMKRFFIQGGWGVDEISFPVDHTVYIIEGSIKLKTGDQRQGTYTETILLTDSSYHVPAREDYDIVACQNTKMVCFFSQAADGTLPDDD